MRQHPGRTKSNRVFGLTKLAILLNTAQLVVAQTPGYVELSVSRSATPAASTLRKRYANLSLTRTFNNDTYAVTVDIGTPKQTVKLAVDVGSYVTWTIGDCEPNYSYAEECRALGTYNTSLSTTSEYVSVSHKEGWLNNDDGSSYSLDYSADDFTIDGENTLKNITLGVYNYANTANYGSLGLGFGQGVNSNRSNVVDELVLQGVTQAKAFGLALGTNNGPNEGSLVLGGIDTKKFSGALQRVPVIDPPTYPFDYSEYRYWMDVDKLTLRGDDGNVTSYPSFKVMTHSTSELSYLPLDIVNEVAAAYGIRNTGDWMNEWYIIPCRYRDIVQGSVDLHFGALNVNIPYSDFIISSQMLEEINYATAPVKCYLSIFPWDENFRDEVDFYYLGHTFLRAVYAVYDQNNRAVWLANRNDCGSDIKGITKDGSSIRGVKGAVRWTGS
ncbi:putative Aspartic peptidase domain-containing protein [Seiridium unicorne]|uniref:Aspartic peptidase domain-containing protein n=1 Tax=Seiridium unicorne TaxID=138068 RepID=A0ABR2V839_9PEZI